MPPDDPTTNAPPPAETPPPAAPETPPAEAAVSRADFEALVSRYDTLEAAYRQVVQSGGQLPPAAPAAPDITDEQIRAAIDDGDSFKAMTLMTQRTERRLAAQQQQFQTLGLQLLEDNSAEIARGQMPHYERFRREIDQHIASLDPSIRASAKARKLAHDYVVGANMGKLLQEERQKWEREAAAARAADPNSQAGPSRSRVLPEGIPTAAELLGADAASALAEKGWTEDDYARRRGYKDWEDYVKKTEITEEVVNGYTR